MSLDGRIDDLSAKRLVLSSPEDLTAVEALRARQDAILVGANTLRVDNPRLVLHSHELRQQRVKERKRPDLIKVTLSASGNLDPTLAFFQTGTGEKIVYCAHAGFEMLKKSLGDKAVLVYYPAAEIAPQFILEDLFSRGVERILIEGGRQVHTMFLQAGLIDELRIAVAPFFVGEAGAPSFVAPGRYPFNKENRMELASLERLGDTAVLNFKVKN